MEEVRHVTAHTTKSQKKGTAVEMQVCFGNCSRLMAVDLKVAEDRITSAVVCSACFLCDQGRTNGQGWTCEVVRPKENSQERGQGKHLVKWMCDAHITSL